MEWKLLIAVFIFISRSVESSLPCSFIETVNITGGYVDINQNFIDKSDVYPLGSYQEFDYIEDIAKKRVSVDPHIRGCVCKLKPCIRLCGPSFEKNPDDFVQPDSFSVINDNNEDETIDLNDNYYGILVGRPCKVLYELDVTDYDDDRWNFLKNGSIYKPENKQVHNVDEYCFRITNKSVANAYVCFEDSENTADNRFFVYPIGMLISIPFLIITFLIYACVPELQNIHGRSLMCYTFSLTVLYAALISAQMDIIDLYSHQTICKSVGYLIYLAAFLSFFWMNVMCYDIWKIARKAVRRSQQEECKTFIIYSIYSITCPLLMTGTVILLDHFKPFDQHYLPMVGLIRCWIQSQFKAEAIYMYTPISIIILLNVALFGDTARNIWNFQNSSVKGGKGQMRNRILRRRFFIYLRLFILMGFMWSMESISWLVGSKSIFFYIMDFFNCIQGLLIFLICVCDVRTRQLLVKRFCPTRFTSKESVTAIEEIEQTPSDRFTISESKCKNSN
ncbi:G-protein coupled receptor Mth2-like [Chironomus tepperi]|uniref:G-protein coupled receptor Mth2-like n=1 Tax=Chironomus tepperi TaxID=113505 RepID=UPI00391F0314